MNAATKILNAMPTLRTDDHADLDRVTRAAIIMYVKEEPYIVNEWFDGWNTADAIWVLAADVRGMSGLMAAAEAAPAPKLLGPRQAREQARLEALAATRNA